MKDKIEKNFKNLDEQVNILKFKGVQINDENYDYLIYPDYLKDKVAEENKPLIEIPSHNFVSKNPFERIEMRYAVLEKLI